jgi:chitodextrinase
MWVRNTGQSPINPGNLMIFAANGLTGNGPTGTAVPAPASSQLISNSHTVNMGWTQLTYWYTPNSNYNQLWIYPFRAGGSVNFGQYELIVDRINVFEVPLGVGVVVPCGGDIVLNAPGGCPGVAYDWYDPAMNYVGSGTVIIPNADPSMSGNYTLKITSGDCTAESGKQIMVEDCEPCDKFEPDFLVEGECNPRTFIDISSGPGTSVAWFWEFGDGTTSNQQNPTHTYATGGVYEVCLTVIRKSGRETCCKRICKRIDVCDPHVNPGEPGEPSDPVGFRYDYMNATQQAVLFRDAIKSDKAVCDYQWDFGDGTYSNLPNPAHVYEQPGLYNVCLKVQHCGYDSKNQLSKSPSLSYCQMVRVNGSLTASEINVIPNPAGARATVTVRNITNATVSLRDMYGTEVAKAKASENGKYIFELSGLTPGVYMVTVEGKEGKFTKKLVKQ